MKASQNNAAKTEKEQRLLHGFTLIELLVVIAIIAVLASLLLGAISKSKASAYSVKCKSNLRQLSIATALYIGDHGVYPYIGMITNNEASGPGNTWWWLGYAGYL